MATTTRSRSKRSTRSPIPSTATGLDFEGFAVLSKESETWEIYGITLDEDEAHRWVGDVNWRSNGKARARRAVHQLVEGGCRLITRAKRRRPERYFEVRIDGKVCRPVMSEKAAQAFVSSYNWHTPDTGRVAKAIELDVRSFRHLKRRKGGAA